MTLPPGPATQRSESASLLTPEVLAEAKRIELRTRRRMSTDLIGSYRSAFRGSGLVFSELREYAPGDDVKKIDWKATIRTQRPYVKTFQEDRQLQVLLAVDTSRSTVSGGTASVHRLALDFSALVALLANRSQDRIGLCTFSDEIEEFLPARQTRAQLHRILTVLLRERAYRPATNLAGVLEGIRQYQRRQSIIFIVSDFYTPPFDQQLRALAIRHDVVLVHLAGPDSVARSEGIVRFLDAETGQPVVLDTSSRYVRSALREAREARLRRLQETSRACGTDLIELHDNAMRPLLQLMQSRMRRVR